MRVKIPRIVGRSVEHRFGCRIVAELGGRRHTGHDESGRAKALHQFGVLDRDEMLGQPASATRGCALGLHAEFLDEKRYAFEWAVRQSGCDLRTREVIDTPDDGVQTAVHGIDPGQSLFEEFCRRHLAFSDKLSESKSIVIRIGANVWHVALHSSLARSKRVIQAQQLVLDKPSSCCLYHVIAIGAGADQPGHAIVDCRQGQK